MNRIARFEALAEQWVEGTFARLFGGHIHPLEVATHVARAMEDACSQAADGTPLAPTHYRIDLHPQDLDALRARHPAPEEELARYVEELAHQAGMVLPTTPTITLNPLPDLPSHTVRVQAFPGPAAGEDESATRQMNGEAPPPSESPPGRCFLIIGGQRQVPLTAPTINIGRALDNDIIIEHPHVSRHHAQLRRRYGRYVIYDLGSSGGTLVNGYPVQECVLRTGDVISLASFEIIYGEEPASPPGEPSEEASTTAGIPVQPQEPR
ncbi:MAG: FHA domain-containing protein [Anaerolineae bacterium]|nr:FHA domain-containing protein [Anaerolineae bacterium]